MLAYVHIFHFFPICLSLPLEIIDEGGEVLVFGALLLQQAPCVARLLLQQLQVKGTHKAGVAAPGPAWEGASVHEKERMTIGKASL